jgi:hypothetical protein
MNELKRLYAKRLAGPHVRRAQVTFRASLAAKSLLAALARARRMSTSEYLARLVSDHLAAMTGARR